jgi:hypothetical protein
VLEVSPLVDRTFYSLTTTPGGTPLLTDAWGDPVQGGS